MTGEEKIIEALGRVDEKYIENSANFNVRVKTDEPQESESSVVGLKEITVPAYKRKKPPKLLKWAAGIAAALALVGGALFVWMNIRDSIGIGGQDIEITLPSEKTIPPVTEPVISASDTSQTSQPEPSVTVPSQPYPNDLGGLEKYLLGLKLGMKYEDASRIMPGGGTVSETTDEGGLHTLNVSYDSMDFMGHDAGVNLGFVEYSGFYASPTLVLKEIRYLIPDKSDGVYDDLIGGIKNCLARNPDYSYSEGLVSVWDIGMASKLTISDTDIYNVDYGDGYLVSFRVNDTDVCVPETSAYGIESLGELTWYIGMGDPVLPDAGSDERGRDGVIFGMKTTGDMTNDSDQAFYFCGNNVKSAGGGKVSAVPMYVITVNGKVRRANEFMGNTPVTFDPVNDIGQFMEVLEIGDAKTDTINRGTLTNFTILITQKSKGDNGYEAEFSQVYDDATVERLLTADGLSMKFTVEDYFNIVDIGTGRRFRYAFGPTGRALTEITGEDTAASGSIETVTLAADDNSYGITLEAKDVTPDSVTVVYRQSGGTFKGKPAYVSEYHILRYIADDVWKPLLENPTLWGPVPEPITLNGTTERKIKSDAPLADGKYRVVLYSADVSDFTEYPTYYSTQTVELEFEVTGSTVQLSDMELDLSGYPYVAVMPDAPQMPAFRLQNRFITDHEGNPGERTSLFTGWDSMTADGTVYSQQTVEMDLTNAYRELSDYIGDAYDVSALAIALEPYCSENGDLLYERFSDVSKVKLYDPETSAGYTTECFKISDNWLVFLSDGGKGIAFAKRNDELTEYRKALEALWAGHDNFPSISVVAVIDNSVIPNKSYLEIIAEEDVQTSVRAYLAEKGIDTGIELRFVTPAEERASYLPVTRISEADGKVYKDDYNSPYFRTIDGELYGCEFPLDFTPKTAAERLTELGFTAEAEKVSGMNTSVGTFDNAKLSELERPLVYNDLFDLAAFGKTNGSYWRISENVVISNFDGELGFVLWIRCTDSMKSVAGKELLKELETVMFFRRYPKMSELFYQSDGTSKDYEIKSIEIVYDGGERLKEIRIIAGKDEWEAIKKWVKYWADDIDTSLLTFAEEPVDLSSAEYIEWN